MILRSQLNPVFRYPSPPATPAQRDTANRLPGDPNDEHRRSSLLSNHLRTLSRFRWSIALCAILGAFASLLVSLTTPTIYRAQTSLELQAPNLEAPNRHTLPPTGSAENSSTQTYVQAQVKLLQTKSLLDRTITRLQADPHPQFIRRVDRISRLGRVLHLSGSEPLAYQALIENAAKQVNVKPLGGNRLVGITCSSPNAAFAAKFCNTLAQEFKDEVDEGITAPRADAPNASDSLAQQLQQQLTELQTYVAEIVPPLAEDNPKVVDLRSQIGALEARLAAERNISTAGLENELQAARHREALLRAAYQALQQDASSDLGKASRLNQLRRELETEQQLDQTLLARAKQAGLAADAQLSTIRIVDAARAASTPVTPRNLPAAGLGLLLGSAFGIALALFKERRPRPADDLKLMLIHHRR